MEDQGIEIVQHVVQSKQDGVVKVDGVENVINCVSCDYNGFASSKEVRDVAKKAIDERGFSVASAPQICGTSVREPTHSNRTSMRRSTKRLQPSTALRLLLSTQQVSLPTWEYSQHFARPEMSS